MFNLFECSSNYSDTAGSLWFYSKDEATNFNADILNINAFRSFMYKAKLLGNIVSQPAPNENNGILKNATIAVLLNYLSYIWRSLEMPLISCRVVLKLRWKKHCVLSALGIVNAVNDDSANSDNVIFTIKTQNYMFLCYFISKR